MIKAILIDQPEYTRHLKAQLAMYCRGKLLVLASFHTYTEALTTALATTPDLIILDPSLNGRDGFDFLDKVNVLDVEIIFTCGDCTYILQSFKYEPVDFLVKPVDSLYLRRAIERCERRLEYKHMMSTKSSFNDLGADELSGHKIALRTEEGLSLLKIAEIVRIEACRSYSVFHHLNGERVVVSQTLKTWEAILHNAGFFRVHDSHLVNLKYVQKFLKKEGGVILLQNGEMIYVARRRKKLLIKQLMEQSIGCR